MHEAALAIASGGLINLDIEARELANGRDTV